MNVKDCSRSWWALTPSLNLTFYGTGDSPTEHHNGNSTPVVKCEKADGDLLRCTTRSGSVYLIRRSRMFPNIHVAIALTRLLDEYAE